jgi:hypothetical protein
MARCLRGSVMLHYTSLKPGSRSMSTSIPTWEARSSICHPLTSYRTIEATIVATPEKKKDPGARGHYWIDSPGGEALKRLCFTEDGALLGNASVGTAARRAAPCKISAIVRKSLEQHCYVQVMRFIDLKGYNYILTNAAVKFGNRQRAYVYNNRNNPIKKKPTDSGSLFFFLKNWANVFASLLPAHLLASLSRLERRSCGIPTAASTRMDLVRSDLAWSLGCGGTGPCGPTPSARPSAANTRDTCSALLPRQRIGSEVVAICLCSDKIKYKYSRGIYIDMRCGCHLV